MVARFLVLALVSLVLTAPGALLANEADWFTQNGFTVLEAVGTQELGYVLVGANESGVFHLLTKGDWYKDRFSVDAIGTEQVKVTTKDKTSNVAPILHRNIPADVLLLALATIYQRSIVIGAQIDSLKPFDPELLTDAAKLAEYCREEGLDLRVFDDCMVVRKGAFAADLKPYSSATPQLAIGMNVLRGTINDVAERLAKASGKVVTPVGAPKGPLTVRSFGLSGEALAYYVQKAADVSLKIEAPKPAPVVVAAPVAAAPRAPRPAKYQELMKAGQYLAAARLAKAAVKKDPTKAKYLNAFAAAVWKLGHKKMAVKVWQKSLRVEPGNAHASRALAQVRQALAAKKAAATTAVQ